MKESVWYPKFLNVSVSGKAEWKKEDIKKEYTNKYGSNNEINSKYGSYEKNVDDGDDSNMMIIIIMIVIITVITIVIDQSDKLKTNQIKQDFNANKTAEKIGINPK